MELENIVANTVYLKAREGSYFTYDSRKNFLITLHRWFRHVRYRRDDKILKIYW